MISISLLLWVYLDCQFPFLFFFFLVPFGCNMFFQMHCLSDDRGKTNVTCGVGNTFIVSICLFSFLVDLTRYGNQPYMWETLLQVPLTFSLSWLLGLSIQEQQNCSEFCYELMCYIGIYKDKCLLCQRVSAQMTLFPPTRMDGG